MFINTLALWQVPLCVVLNSVQAQYYHQSDYGVKLDRMEVPSYNHSSYSDVKAGFVWYNRTTRVVNASGNILKNMTSDIRVDIQVYKFLSNEYRFFPITMSGYVCDTLKKNLFGLTALQKKYSNLKDCPTPAGFYYLRNAVVDFSLFPPYIPSGQYKLSAKGYYKSEFSFEVNFYAEVNTFITKWEN